MGKSARRRACAYTEKQGHTSMPRAEFEPMIPVFELSKSIRALDRVAIGTYSKDY